MKSPFLKALLPSFLKTSAVAAKEKEIVSKGS